MPTSRCWWTRTERSNLKWPLRSRVWRFMDWANPPVTLTYNNVLPGFESIDVMGVMAITHLPQDGCHAGHENTLEEEKTKHLIFFSCLEHYKFQVWYTLSQFCLIKHPWSRSWSLCPDISLFSPPPQTSSSWSFHLSVHEVRGKLTHTNLVTPSKMPHRSRKCSSEMPHPSGFNPIQPRWQKSIFQETLLVY